LLELQKGSCRGEQLLGERFFQRREKVSGVSPSTSAASSTGKPSPITGRDFQQVLCCLGETGDAY